MKNIGLITILLSFLLYSCTKDEITVNLKSAGKLTVRITDKNGTGITNTKVKLYDYYSTFESGSMLDEKFTDNNGFIDFGEFNSGTYTLLVDTPKVNNIKYLPVKTVQVLTGGVKNLSLNVEDYVGKMELTFLSYSYSTDDTHEPLQGMNVIAVPYELYSYNLSLEKLIPLAEYSKITNENGNVSFTLPSTRVFWIVIYNADKTDYNVLGYIYLDKDEIFKRTMYLDPDYLYKTPVVQESLNGKILK